MSTAIPYIYMAIGGCLLIYFIILWIHCARIPAFGWFWLLAGFWMVTLGLFTMDYNFIGPDGVTTLFYDDNISALRSFCIEKLPILLLVLLAIFVAELYILSKSGKRQPSKDADYIIILGAHVNGIIPSRALMSRIMAAYEYMKDNPSTKAVLTGGQGRGEQIAEAFCMKRELLKLGIEEERLFLEDKSTTTEENITFAKRIIADHVSALHDAVQLGDETLTDNKNQTDPAFYRNIDKLHVTIVTNDFHALRGMWIARKSAFKKIDSIGASSSLIMKPHYYTREILSWIKLCIISTIKKPTI